MPSQDPQRSEQTRPETAQTSTTAPQESVTQDLPTYQKILSDAEVMFEYPSPT
jgi:hypothetical protein